MVTEKTEITGVVKVACDIKERVKTTGIRGLNLEKAAKLGVFDRLANLICVVHSSIMTAYRVFGEVEYIFEELKANKHEIAREMNAFNKAYERFVKFWSDYYVNKKSSSEANFEIESLYHRIMEWMQLPETWQLGDEQRIPCKKEFAIDVEIGDGRVFTFYKAVLDQETIESKETWGVLCFDPKKNVQVTVNTNMDKASALMVAKRLSAENPQNIYSASIIRDVVEKRTEVVPFKAFHANETVGKLVK